MNKLLRMCVLCSVVILMMLVVIPLTKAEEKQQDNSSISADLDYIPIFGEGGSILESEITLDNDWVISDNNMIACKIASYSAVSYAEVKVNLDFGVVLLDNTVTYCTSSTSNFNLYKNYDGYKFGFEYSKNITDFVYNEEKRIYTATVAVNIIPQDGKKEATIVTLDCDASSLMYYYSLIIGDSNPQEETKQDNAEVASDEEDFDAETTVDHAWTLIADLLTHYGDELKLSSGVQATLGGAGVRLLGDSIDCEEYNVVAFFDITEGTINVLGKRNDDLWQIITWKDVNPYIVQGNSIRIARNYHALDSWSNGSVCLVVKNGKKSVLLTTETKAEQFIDFCMLVSGLPKSAFDSGDFDPSSYSVEELSAIQDSISNYLSSTDETDKNEEDKNVLYNENGIYIEYRGIAHYSRKSWIVNIYVDNSSGKDIYVDTNNVRINRFAIGLSNDGARITDGSIYLANPNYDFIINVEDIKEYGISAIEKIEFDLRIYEGSWISGEQIAEVPITLEMYEQITE